MISLDNIAAGLTKPKVGDPAKKREFVKDGRENWKDYLDMPVETDKNQKLKDIIYNVSRKTGVRPEVLFTSAMEEGLQQASHKGTIAFSKDDHGSYIDGYSALGLDNFGSDADSLAKSGYLKKDITYQPYDSVNEKGDKIKTAFFSSLEDGLYAKAAYLNRAKDSVTKYATENKLNLNDDAKDFLSMQAYNAGEGIIPKAVKKYQDNKLMDNNSFLEKAPAGGYSENPSYYNTRKRYDNMKNLQDQGAFADYKP
jgi:hypothetical protein